MKPIKIGDKVKSVGSFVSYKGTVTKEDGLHVWVKNNGLEFRLPKNMLKVVKR
jgi:hypothetical protein